MTDKFVSKSWWEPTPENIKKAADLLEIPKDKRPKLTRREGETDQKLYERYLLEMTVNKGNPLGQMPCVFCNGPRIAVLVNPARSLKWEGRVQTWPEEWGAPRCVRFPIHNALDFLQTDEQRMRALGKPCEHGYYTSECPECKRYLDHEKKPKK